MPKIITIAYNVKGCLRFSNFIFWILSNVAKYDYGWSPLEQHQKIGKKNWAKLAIIHKKDFAKFGYRLDVKVENFNNPFIFWLLDGTCDRNLALKEVQIWKINPIFFRKIPWMCRKYIFQIRKWKKSPEKKPPIDTHTKSHY